MKTYLGKQMQQQQTVDGAAIAVGGLAAYPWIAEINEVTTLVSTVIAAFVGVAIIWHRIELARKLRRERKDLEQEESSGSGDSGPPAEEDSR